MRLTNLIVIAAMCYALNAHVYVRKNFRSHNDDADYVTVESSRGHGLPDVFVISYLSTALFSFPTFLRGAIGLLSCLSSP